MPGTATASVPFQPTVLIVKKYFSLKPYQRKDYIHAKEKIIFKQNLELYH